MDAGAWEFMSLNVPTVAAVDWAENSSGLVFDVFNHEFPSGGALSIATDNE